MDHLVNSAAKTNYMSAGNISVPIVFRGPNGAAAGVGAQHSQVWITLMFVIILLSSTFLARELIVIPHVVLPCSATQRGMVRSRA